MTPIAPKRVLMIAYHFPPSKGSSGSLRTLSFARHLPQHGWNPLILTASPRAYQEVGTDQLKGISPDLPVCRAFALDSARHLAIKGRYLSWTALPDRWVSWIAGGVPAGLRMIRKYQPQVIWVTYPTASALWIGYILHRLTRIPLVTDLRDPLTEEDSRTGVLYPTDKKLWKARRAIESRSILRSSRTVLVTPGSKKLHAERYPQLPSGHWTIIPNGYEEASFAELESGLRRSKCVGAPLRLLHSGFLYPTPDRDPSAFFAALADLKSSGMLSPGQIVVTLRASGFVERYQTMIRAKGLEEIVKLEPAIPYRDALREMLLADGLLVFQSYTSNPAIPAKLYEYLRARRPIFAMVDADGDTAATLRAVGSGTIASLESSDQIRKGLVEFLGLIRSGTAPLGDPTAIRGFARETHAVLLAALLDEVSAQPTEKVPA
jgi:glycosyltransferase involved in cell wall biosynthesis